MNFDYPFVSVVIGFKDWGLERLELSSQSIHRSLLHIPHEIVISDYGSEDIDGIARVAARVEAIHERVATSGEWSRSRALNAGVRAAKGDIILATDADMIFTPAALTRVVDQLLKHPQEIVILQCRDLPVGFSHDVISAGGFDWTHFAAISQIRPRWGMGGLVGVHRSIWESLRGWDERMHTYGGEDVDFGKRAQRYGSRIDWLDEPGVAMYHIWHPSSVASATRSREATAAIEANRRIQSTDLTFARNRVHARYLPEQMLPLVSVVVDGATEDEEALSATLSTVLAQSVSDIEVFVIGRTDLAIRDPRVKTANSLTLEVSGTFTTVARPGEIWDQNRLESLLGHWEPYVGIINDQSTLWIRDDDSKLSDGPKPYSDTALNHRTSLVRTSLLDPDVEFSDAGWLECVARTVASGAKWIISPELSHLVVATPESEEILRTEEKVSSSTIQSSLIRCGLSLPDKPEPKRTGRDVLREALISESEILVRADIGAGISISPNSPVHDPSQIWAKTAVKTLEGRELRSVLEWVGSDYAYAVYAFRDLAASGAQVSLHRLETSSAKLEPIHMLASVVGSLEEIYGDPESAGLWLVSKCEGVCADELEHTFNSMRSITTVQRRIIETPRHSLQFVCARYRGRNLGEALATAASLKTTAPLQVVAPRYANEGRRL